ncbi:MAG: pyroglutamyl-peptidase I [Planctomycetes bacterium]|nr:pyroglutamyl-peptidase I [Planctomycetota bacterium]
MPRVLLTAFKPYDRWRANASWLALMELTRELPPAADIVTRLYPVDYAEVKERLAADLQEGFDFALHLGQAPGAGRLELEKIGVNVQGPAGAEGAEPPPLVEGGPVAYESSLPLARWAAMLRREAIPAQVSYHAGTYLCNAALYLTHHLSAVHGYRTQAAFIHLPLDVTQTAQEQPGAPSLPAAVSARAVRLILEQLGAVEPSAPLA